MEGRPLNLVIMGPPGGGKGTQASTIARDYSLSHLATGDILRRELADGTVLGKKAKGTMESGGLVPDGIILEMIAGKVVESARKTGFILDGFPRTVAQARAVDDILVRHEIGLSAVLTIRVADAVILGRLANRKTCPKCQAVYHPVGRPPKRDGVCDGDGQALVTRPDDTEEVIRRRLAVYQEQTAPLIDYYRPRGLLREIDGDGPVDTITQSIRVVLDAMV